ncbi:MAG: metallophosphoesterase [Bacteroidota bacterium]
MRIIQITDLHIDLAGAMPFEIDVRDNFKRVLDEVLLLRPDHLVITGDLCYRDGDAKIYEWIYDQMDQQPVPYDVLAGNHDDSSTMARVFGKAHMLNDGEYYYAKKLKKFHCLFLDSARGSHSLVQLKWLERQLRQADAPVLIFMHHPPTKAGVPFMDNKYPLQDIEAVQKVFFEHPHPISVFCGHYHVEKTIAIQNVCVQITPSCFFQIDQQEEDFKVDHHRIAYRIIDLDKDCIQSTVRYLEGSKGA